MVRYWLFTFACALVTACSGESDPPLLQKKTGGTGGGAAEAGEGPSSGGSTSGSGGNGGTGGTGNTGGFGRPDPNEVYILGTLELANLEVSALCHWSTPDDYAVGFDPLTNNLKAKVGEDGLLYQLQNVPEIRRFVPDNTSSQPLESIAYPVNAADNDPVVAELDCPGGVVFLLHFVVGPGDRIIYNCGPDRWFEDGEPLYDGMGDIIALGNDDLVVYTEYGVGHFIVNLASGEKTQIEDIGTIYAARAIRGGFLVAGIGVDGDELWEVGANGVARSRGLYTEQEPGIFRYFYALDADGILYQLDQVGPPETILTRRRVGGSNEDVYSDLEPGNVFIGGHGLATGP